MCTQPSTDGPMIMPPMTSSTTAGMRSRGKYPTTSGASTATAATTSRLVNETSGMANQPLAEFGHAGRHPGGPCPPGGGSEVGQRGRCLRRHAGYVLPSGGTFHRAARPGIARLLAVARAPRRYTRDVCNGGHVPADHVVITRFL